MYKQQYPIGLAGGLVFYRYVGDPNGRVVVFGLNSSLLKGKLEIYVKTRHEAEMILYQMQLAKGYTSSSGFDPSSAKTWFWKNKKIEKRNFYHWDDKWVFNDMLKEYVIDVHDPFSKDPELYKHARNPHLQFHNYDGGTQRVFWEHFDNPNVCHKKG